MTPQCCALITEDADIYRNADHFIMKCIGCKELDYPVISFGNTKELFENNLGKMRRINFVLQGGGRSRCGALNVQWTFV